MHIHTHTHTYVYVCIHTHTHTYMKQTNRYRNQICAYQSGEGGKDKLGVQN